MTITIIAFERSPDGGKGLARDTRARSALEEVGQPYEVRLVSFRAMWRSPRIWRFIRLPDSDLRGRRSRPVRDMGDRVPYRRAPCGPGAGRCQCPGARD